MDPFVLLSWLVRRETEGLHAPSGGDVLADCGKHGIDWDQTTQAASALLDRGWIDGHWMGGPLQQPPPRGVGHTSQEFQQYRQLYVTSDGYSAHRARTPEAAPGQVFNISGSQIGQLAAGDITNVDIDTWLIAIEQAIDGVEASDEAKAEAKQTVSRIRELVSQTGTAAAGGVIGAAVRSVLNLP